MISHKDMFRRIAQEIEILDENSFRHDQLGILSPNGFESAELGPKSLLAHLWRVIYLFYYAGDDTLLRQLLDGDMPLVSVYDHEDADFVESLRKVNLGLGPLSTGWTVVERTGAWCTVTRDGLTLRVDEKNLASFEDGRVAFRLPPERRYASPGWYVLLGDEWTGGIDRMVRIYFTIARPHAAPNLVADIAARLNSSGIPFQLKLVNHPRAFERKDTCVVYLSGDDWDEIAFIFGDIHRGHTAYLRNDYPCFALPLAHGMSFAEEPNLIKQKLSFGEHRSLLVAEGLVQAFHQGLSAKSVEDKFASIAQRYQEEGLDLARPYLNATHENYPTSHTGRSSAYGFEKFDSNG